MSVPGPAGGQPSESTYGAGCATGGVFACVIGVGVLFLAGAAGPPGVVVAAVVVVAGAFALLLQRDRFLRGVGAGLLLGSALVLLTFGLCVALVAGSL